MDGLLFTLVARANGSHHSDGAELRSERTEHLIHKLILENDIRNRTSTLLLVAFNVAAAALVIASILYDAWKVSKRSPLKSERYEFLRMIHPAEVVPLALTTAIVIQGIIFLGVQGAGLRGARIRGCRSIDQVVFPSVWIVGYVLLIFSSETAYRSLRKNRFGPRGWWNTCICLAVVLLMLLLTWVPSAARKARRDKCLGSLLLFAAPWSDVAFGINLLLIISYITIGTILVVQLLRTVDLDREDRIAASRVVYYLAVGTVLFTFVIPFWAKVAFSRHAGVTSMMATISLNLFGIMYFFLHLLLRSNADSMAIRPVNAPWWRNKGWRFFGSNGLDIGKHITTPIRLERSDSAVGLGGGLSEKSNYADIEASTTGGGSTEFLKPPSTAEKGDAYKSLPPPPPVEKSQNTTTTTTTRHSRKKSSYSLFPTKESARQMRFPSSIYDTDDNFLVPPQAPFARTHSRYSSGISTATVQIGLRLSNVGILQNPFLAVTSPSRPNSPYGPAASNSNAPALSGDDPAAPKSPKAFDKDSSAPDNVPQAESTSEVHVSKPMDSSETPKGGSRAHKRQITRSVIMKDLPPPPPLSTRNRETVAQPATKLQPLPEIRSQETSPKEGSCSDDSFTTLPSKAYVPGE